MNILQNVGALLNRYTFFLDISCFATLSFVLDLKSLGVAHENLVFGRYVQNDCLVT